VQTLKNQIQELQQQLSASIVSEQRAQVALAEREEIIAAHRTELQQLREQVERLNVEARVRAEASYSMLRRLDGTRAQLSVAESRSRQLAESLESMKRFSAEVYRLIDDDKEVKAMKLAGAMAGNTKYRHDVDTALAVLANPTPAASERELQLTKLLTDGLRIVEEYANEFDEVTEWIKEARATIDPSPATVEGEKTRRMTVALPRQTPVTTGSPFQFPVMKTCPACGNKRCPHAEDRKWKCTGSNEPDQPRQLRGKPCTCGQSPWPCDPKALGELWYCRKQYKETP